MLCGHCFLGRSYVFSTGASIEEVGKIADNDSVSFADGFIRFNISEAFIELNYTGNAEAYNLAICMHLLRQFGEKRFCLHFLTLQIIQKKMDF